MSNISNAREGLVRRLLEGAGRVSPSERRAAFGDRGLDEPLASLVNKVANHAWRVTDEDITGALASGRSEDQIFEIVVCAAIGQATRQYDATLAALAAATGKE